MSFASLVHPLSTLAPTALGLAGAQLAAKLNLSRHSYVTSALDYAQTITAGLVAISILGAGGAGCATFVILTGAHAACKWALHRELSSKCPWMEKREFLMKMDARISFAAALINSMGCLGAAFGSYPIGSLAHQLSPCYIYLGAILTLGKSMPLLPN
ncbi:MAG: hypothetical protein WC222_02240 [Parachlamydiales bacterium]|jgi:hypothetical protein